MSLPFQPLLLRRLPRPVVPFPNETLDSYWNRLALANRVKVDELHSPSGWLRRYEHTRSLDEVLSQLTTLTGLPRVTLWHALPELRWRHPSYRLDTHRAKARWGRWSACRRCAATHAHGYSVMTWTSRLKPVCCRHALWIGDGVRGSGQQVDLSHLPHTVEAQRRLNRVVRRFGEGFVTGCLASCRPIWRAFAGHHFTQSRDHDRSHLLIKVRGGQSAWGPQLYAATFPELVAMLRMVTSPSLRAPLATTMYQEDVDRFMTEFERRLPPGSMSAIDAPPRLANMAGSLVRGIERRLQTQSGDS